ncbi:MAG TPA: diacylglycerol kinase family protein [Nocardioides sp.]|nr:diacylglycerol kinase family protein [Nocardioides sp.]
MPTSRAMFVITNSDAGTADREALDAALAVLREHAEVEVAATSSPDELDEALGAVGDRTVVVAGGDGSIHAVVAALHRSGGLGGATIGLVPLGTGNDFARTLGLPLEAAAAAEVVAAGHPRRVDVVVGDQDEITVNSVHLGAGADAGAKGARWKERLGSVGVGGVNLGRLGYPIGAMQTALNPPTLRLRVEVDGEVVADLDERVLMVALGNGASVGGGTELTPDADPGDGLIDVLVATPVGTLSRLGYALRLPFGKHGEHADVRIVRGAEVRVSGTPFDCNSDGEIDGPFRERTWRVLPSAYTMLVPG